MLPACARGMVRRGIYSRFGLAVGPGPKAHPACAPAMLTWRHIEVHVNGVAHDGTQSSVAHVVYQYEDGSTFWEYDPMLRCFLEDRKSVELWKEAKKERCALEKLANEVFVQFSALYQPSVRMCQRDASIVPNAYTRSVQTLATTLVILQHVLWAAAAWKHRQKARATSMGRALFERCLPEDAFSLGAATQVYESGVDFCPEVLGNECPHLSLAVLRDIVADGGAPQAAAWACLVMLLPKLGKCGLAKHIFKWIVVVASQAIDRSFESKSMGMAPQKIELKQVGASCRKRAPDSYKQFVMTMVRSSNRGINGKAAMKLDGYAASRHHAWMLKEVCMYQAACARNFVQKGVFGVWEDAARLGKPAREVLLMVGFSSGDQQGCILPPQVLPDWRGQQTGADGKWTARSSERWKVRCQSFFNKIRPKLAAKDSNLTSPKKANWYSILALDQGIDSVWGIGLQMFAPKRRLTPLQEGTERFFLEVSRLPTGVQASSSNRPLRSMLRAPDKPAALEAVWSGRRPCLQITLDQGSVGWPSRGWLFHRCGLRGHRWLDPCHRHANNLTDSLCAAGLGVFKAEALVVVNTDCGPWHEAANHDREAGCMEEYMASASIDDDLFLSIYPWMSWDMHSGELPGSYGTPEHRMWVWEQARDLGKGGPGMLVQLNRWFQLWQKLRPFLATWSLHLFRKAIQCIQKGYYQHVSELALLADEGSTGTVVGLSAAAGVPDVASSSRTVKGSSGGNLEALRGRCRNAVHLCTEVLSSRGSRSALLFIDAFVRPLEIYHNETIKLMKTRRGRQEYNVSAAAGERVEHIRRTVDVFYDRGLLVNAGLISAGPGLEQFMLPACLREELLQSMFHLWRQLAAMEICQSMQHSFHMPGLAFAQLHHDPAVRSACMQRMRRLWSQLELAERCSWQDARLKSWVRDLEWPNSQWSRELCIAAAECRWEFLPDDIRAELTHASQIASTSKVVEDSFNECRAQTEGTRNGRQSPEAVWHSVAASSIAADFDLNPVRPSSADAVASPASMPSAMFHARSRESAVSLAGVTQTSFLADVGGPTLAPSRHLQLGCANHALSDAPAPGAMTSCWRSLIAVEGSLVWCDGLQEAMGIVLSVTPHSMVLWKGHMAQCGDLRHFVLERSGAPWQVETVWDAYEWQCAAVAARDPGGLVGGLRRGLPESEVIFEITQGTEGGLLAFSAWRGFPHLTLEMLDRLWREMEIKVSGRRPTLLLEVLRPLCEFFLGVLTEEDWAAILVRREGCSGRKWKSIVEDNAELTKTVTSERDHPEVSKPRAAAPKKRSLVTDDTRRPPVSTSEAGPVAASSSGAGDVPASDGGESAAKKARLVAPFSLRHYTQAEASRYLPKAVGVSISPVANRVWQVKYLSREKRPRSHTATYHQTGDDPAAHVHALVQCLEWAWMVHSVERGLDRCPFDFAAALQGKS